MAPLTCNFGGPSLSPPPLLLLLLLLSLSRVRASTPVVPITISGNIPVTLSPDDANATIGGGDGGGAGGGDVADAGGEDVVDPGEGGDPQTTLPPDEIESNNTPIIVGCILALLIVISLAAVFWKYRSSVKTEQPEAPTSPAEFNEAELEPKGSQLVE